MYNLHQYLKLFSVLIIISTCASVYAAIPIAIYTPNFGATYRSAWQINGDSNFKDDTLQLNIDNANLRGTAFYKLKICNSTDFKFSAFFSFRMVDRLPIRPADGICFVIQQYSNQFGSFGGGIGYENLPGKSIAVEYDTYNNDWDRNDPDNNHVAIDINGSVNHTTNASFTGLNNLVANNSQLSAIGRLVDLRMKYSWIDYDGTTLEVRLSNTLIRPATPIISVAIDLASYFNGTEVYYGFSGATGSQHEENLIYSAYINNKFTPIDILNNTYTQAGPSSSTTQASICQGDSLIFNGRTYHTAGSYVEHLVNAAGCDSVATLELVVNQSSNSITQVSICKGNSYVFNGKNYTTTGKYDVHLTNFAGCDSIATLILDVKPTSSSTTQASICQGNGYVFNGKNYTTTGKYDVHLTNAAGCDSTATLNLTVIPTSSSITRASICQENGYVFNGKNYTTTGKYDVHFTNAAGCDSIATLNLTVNRLSSSTTQASICQGDSLIFNGKTYRTAGSYAEHLVNAAGCDSLATLILTLNPKPNVIATPNTQTICSGEATNIALTTNTTGATITYFWTAKLLSGTVNGYADGNGNGIVQTLTNTGTTPAIVRYVVVPKTGTCEGLPTQVDITVNPKPNVVATPNTRTIQNGESTNIHLSTDITKLSVTYWWKSELLSGKASGFADGTGADINQILTNNTYSNAIVRYTITPVIGNCPGTPITVDITVVKLNDTPLAVVDNYPVKENDEFNNDVSVNDKPSADNPNRWTVTVNPKNGTVLMQANGTFTYRPNLNFNGVDSLTYIITDGDGDKSSAKVYFNVYARPKVEKLASKPQFNDDDQTYSWKYTLIVTNDTKYDMTDVKLEDNLQDVFGPKGCDFKVQNIHAVGTLKANTLFNGKTITNTLLERQTMKAQTCDSVIFEVKVNLNGQKDSVIFLNQAFLKAKSAIEDFTIPSDADTRTIPYEETKTILESIDLYIPDGFSPNGDDYNQTFQIRKSSDMKVDLEVFNRWGNSVFRSHDYQNEWDGRGGGNFLGQNLPTGTYYIIYTVTLRSTGAKYTSGIKYITLRR